MIIQLISREDVRNLIYNARYVLYIGTFIIWYTIVISYFTIAYKLGISKWLTFLVIIPIVQIIPMIYIHGYALLGIVNKIKSSYVWTYVIINIFLIVLELILTELEIYVIPYISISILLISILSLNWYIARNMFTKVLGILLSLIPLVNIALLSTNAIGLEIKEDN